MTVQLTEAKRKFLLNAGFTAPEDYILRLPTSYKDYSKIITGDKSLPASGEHCFSGVVTRNATSAVSDKSIKGKKIRFFAVVRVGNFDVIIEDNRTLQRSPFNSLRKGDEVVFFGSISRINGSFTVFSPDIVLPQWAGKIQPTYKGVHRTFNPAQMLIRVYDALDNKQLFHAAAQKVSVELGHYTIGVDAIQQLLITAHRPLTLSAANEAMEKLCDLNIKSLLSKNIISNTEELSSIKIPDSTISSLHATIPFSLSESQVKTMTLIKDELEAHHPMDMLASGDVGSGKSVIQILSCMYAYSANKRAAIIAPNELLAVQLYNTFISFFPNAPCHLIAKNTRRDIDLDANPVLIGTTAIIFFIEKHTNYNLDLLCLDEQQKIGLNQKKRLLSPTTNLLESTATCIPRSMGNILFTGKKISRIYAHVEKDIKSYITHYQHREQMFNLLHKVIREGGKVAIIYPEIKAEKRTALLQAEQYWEKHYPNQYTILFGGMAPEEKNKAINDVLNGKHPLLLATSIIEIGLDVPDLRMMIVVDADEYGASTLHQMRGRIGRNGGGGIFFMYSSKSINHESNPKSYERLLLVKNQNDGFVIAEKDMESRGVGDIIGDGDKQSGKTLGVFIGLPIETERLTKYLQ
jgi:ATP-dependent DNA helicase RecG